MSNNIAVKITADIVDLQSKFGTARAELQATELEFRKLARASAAGALDDAAKARYAQLSQTLLEQRTALSGLSSDLAQAGFATNTFGRAAVVAGEDAARMGINVSSATRFTRELFDEISSGRTRYLPSTLAELANQGFHLKPAMLFGLGGVAALAGGLGYLAYKAIQADEAMQRISQHAAFIGNRNVTPEVAGNVTNAVSNSGLSSGITDNVESALGLTTTDAQKAAAVITSIPGISTQAMMAIAKTMGLAASALGTTGDKTAATIGKLLDVNTSMRQLQSLLPGMTADQLQQAEAAQQTGNYATITAERYNLFVQALGSGQEILLAQDRKALENAQKFDAAIRQAGLEGKIPPEAPAAMAKLATDTERFRVALDGAEAVSAHPLGPQAEQNQLKAALDAAERLDAKDTERKQLVSQIASMEQAILHANAAQRAELEAGIAAASQKLAHLNGGVPHHHAIATSDSGANARIAALQRLGAAHRREAEQEIADDQRVLQTLLEVQNADAESAQRVLQIRVRSAEQALSAAVSAGRMSAARRLAIEQRLTQALYQQDEQRLKNELATLQAGTPQYARVADQIEVVQAQMYQHLQALADQNNERVRKNLSSQSTLWQAMGSEIMRTEGNLVQNIISGRRTLSQAVLALGQELIAQEIQNDIKLATSKFLIGQEGFAARKTLEQSSLLYHIMVEAEKLLHTQVTEAGRTASHSAAESTRLAATTAARTAGRAAEVVANLATIEGDAAKAGAGAFAAIVGIPYVGPALAPAAAASAVAQVEAFAPMASFAVGAFNVPRDVIAQIHAGETILPRPFADEFRAAARGGGGMGETHYHFAVNALDGNSVRSLLMDNHGAVGEALALAVRNGHRLR